MIFIDVKNHKIPALGFGTYQLKGDIAQPAVEKAIEIGYRHIDTAQIYGNEEEVGAAIKSSGIRREDIFLTTKVWMDKVRDGDLQKSVDLSLQKLKTDYADLILIHWPVADVPFAEQLAALSEVQKKGQAKLIGVSNFTVAQLKEVTEKTGAAIVTDQVEYHPMLSQKPVLDYLRSKNMFLTAYSPLAQGRLKDDKTLADIGGKYGKTAGQVALRWLVQQDRVAAIPKAASEKNMRDNFNIFDFALTDDDMKTISALGAGNLRVINPEWAPKWDIAA